ncbi:MAG: hypothetical protein K0S61_1133 [Anaerocolumna sp.]|jgi:hypothetical protein|nr:hypothetical protein [Anaerocolumna sp.]
MKLFKFKLREKVNLSMVPTILIVVFYFAYFLKMVYGGTIISTIASATMAIIGLLSAGFIILIKRFHFKSRIILLLIILYLFAILSSIYSNNYRVQDYVLPLQYFGVALLLIVYKLNYKVVRFSFIIYSVFFLYNIATGIHPDYVFSGVSRNNISINMILHSVLMYISMYQNRRVIKLYPVIITAVLSFWGIGRSGIISSLALLLGIIFYIQIYTDRSRKFIKMLSIFLIVISAYLGLTTVFYDIILNNAFHRTLLTGLLDPYRAMIITEYVSKCLSSIGAFAFGVPLDNNYIFSLFDYNLHNSFIRLHAYYGFFGFIMILILIVRCISEYIKKRNMLYLFLLGVLLLRMSTDIAGFHGPYDPLIYFFLLNDYIFKKNSKSVSRAMDRSDSKAPLLKT